MSLLHWLISVDQDLFTFINVKASSPSLDWFMKLMREATTWIPIYAFMLYWVIRYARQYALPFIALTIVCFTITDFTAGTLLKPLFGRLRPCYEPALQSVMRHVIDCGGQFGFPSNHASNHFGLAAFWFAAVYQVNGKKWYWLWLWAFIICYAQVYVGKHYPSDILAGAVLGIIVGSLLAIAFRKWISKTRKIPG